MTEAFSPEGQHLRAMLRPVITARGWHPARPELPALTFLLLVWHWLVSGLVFFTVPYIFILWFMQAIKINELIIVLF